MRRRHHTQTIGRGLAVLCTVAVMLSSQVLCKAAAQPGPTPSTAQGDPWARRATDLYQRLGKAVAEGRWSEVTSQAQALKTTVRELEAALAATGGPGATKEPNAGPLARSRARPSLAMRAMPGAESGQATDLVRRYAGRPEDRKALLAAVGPISGHLDHLIDAVQSQRYRLAGQAYDQLDRQWEALESRLDLPKPLELPTPYDPNRPVAWSQGWISPQGGFSFGFSMSGSGSPGFSGGFGMMQMTGPNGTQTWTFQPDSNAPGPWMGPSSGPPGLAGMRVQICRQQLSMLDRMVERDQWPGAGHAVQRIEHAVLDLRQAIDQPQRIGRIRPRARGPQTTPLPDVGDLLRDRSLKTPIRDKAAAASGLASQLREAVSAQDKDRAGQISRQLGLTLDEISNGQTGTGPGPIRIAPVPTGPTP